MRPTVELFHPHREESTEGGSARRENAAVEGSPCQSPLKAGALPEHSSMYAHRRSESHKAVWIKDLAPPEALQTEIRSVHSPLKHGRCSTPAHADARESYFFNSSRRLASKTRESHGARRTARRAMSFLVFIVISSNKPSHNSKSIP